MREKLGIVHQSGEAPAVTETMLELVSTGAEGPIKIQTEQSELQLVPDLFVRRFVSDSFARSWLERD